MWAVLQVRTKTSRSHRIVTRMTLKLLRTLVRESIHASLGEAELPLDEASKDEPTALPKTFDAFRVLLGKALKKAKAPGDFIEEVEDTGAMDGGFVSVLHNAWSNFEAELKDAGVGDDDAMEWLGEVCSDAVLDLESEYNNSMNYGPGRKGAKFDAATIAAGVEQFFISAARRKGRSSSHTASKDDAVADVIEVWLTKFAGKVSDDPSVRYDIQDFAEFLHHFAVEPVANISTIEDRLDHSFMLKPAALRDLSTALYNFAQANFDKRFE